MGFFVYIHQSRILEYTKYEMNLKALEAFEDLGEDEELGPAEWEVVKKYVSCLTTTGPPSHPHATENSVMEIHGNQLQDIRLRLLNGRLFTYGLVTLLCLNVPYRYFVT